MTRMRSATASTSGSSEEITSTATPLRDSSTSRRCTSDFVAMSIPRVGSSTMISDGSRLSHFASTTFCWLPPESEVAGLVIRLYLTCSRLAQSVAKVRSTERTSRPWRVSVRSDARAMLSSIDMSITRPCWRRSSGTKATPERIASSGTPRCSARPPTDTVPLS